MSVIKYNVVTLQRLEQVYKSLGYHLRYEKGNFNAGFCLIQDKNVVVVNKFFDTEARINCLLDIFQEIEIQPEKLDEKSTEFIHKVLSARSI